MEVQTPMNVADAALREYQRFPKVVPGSVEVCRVQMRPELQARDLALVQAGHVAAVERERAELVTGIRRDLEADPAHTTEPIWVAEIDGGLYVVDGWHRLHAFKLAKRQTIPARILTMPHPVAVALSLLVNEGDRRLPRVAGERSEACWQFIGALTEQGTKGAPKGWTQTRVANLCRVHRNTVVKMHAALQRIAGVSLTEYAEHERNRQTRWITWKAAYSHGRTFADDTAAFTSVEEKIIEQARRKIGKAAGKFSDWARQHPQRCIDEAFARATCDAGTPDDLNPGNMRAAMQAIHGEARADAEGDDSGEF